MFSSREESVLENFFRETKCLWATDRLLFFV